MIELIVVTAFFLYGTKVLWQPGMILEKPKLYLDTIIGEGFFRKPLYACPACMASIWGTTAWVLFRPVSWDAWAGWPVFCVAVCGLTWVLLTQFPFDE